MRDEMNKKFNNDYVKVIEDHINKLKPRS